jgi:hypothetical protein
MFRIHRLKFSVAPAIFSIALFGYHAAAQPLSDQEIAAMVPTADRDGKAIAYYRWRDAVPINVVVITDGQRDPCVGAAISQIQGEVDELSRTIPALKIAPRVGVSEWVPDKFEPPMLLIALPMENERIVPALARFARESTPGAKWLVVPRDFNISHGIGRADDPPDVGGVTDFNAAEIRGIDRGRVVHAYSFAVNRRGMEYHTGRCGWDWSSEMLRLLGAEGLDLRPVADWRKATEVQGFKQFDQRVQRLFLRALYADRAEPFDVAALRGVFKSLINDPNAMPVPRAAQK